MLEGDGAGRDGKGAPQWGLLQSSLSKLLLPGDLPLGLLACKPLLQRSQPTQVSVAYSWPPTTAAPFVPSAASTGARNPPPGAVLLSLGLYTAFAAVTWAFLRLQVDAGGTPWGPH